MKWWNDEILWAEYDSYPVPFLVSVELVYQRSNFFFFPSLWFMSYKLRWTVFGFVVHIIFLSPINNNGDRSGVKNKSLMQWA